MRARACRFDVRQRLLRDPVRGDLDGGGERRQRGRRVDTVTTRLRRGLLRGEAPDRGGETELVERRWAQPVDQPADVSDHRLHLRGRRDQQRIGSPEIRRRQIPNGLERERQPGERRAEAVVEVAADPPPLLLAQLDDALPRRLQLVRELDRVDGGGDLRRQVGDQPVVALVGGARPGARREPKLTDGDALVDERERRGLARPARRTPPPPSASTTSADVLQRERLAERLDDGREHRRRAATALVRLRPSRAIAA